VKDVLKIVLAIVIIIVAWKILKGIIGLLIGIAAAGLIVYGGMKLIEGPRNG
jgi:high-affinity Fe2+/Pb2+ permease